MTIKLFKQADRYTSSNHTPNKLKAQHIWDIQFAPKDEHWLLRNFAPKRKEEHLTYPLPSL